MQRAFRIAAAGLLAMGTVAVTPAAAQAVDGCTSPLGDRPFRLASFHQACDDHDDCYRHHEKGAGEAGRRACDRDFLRDMRMACRAADLTSRQHRACNAVAKLYYAGVRLFGWPFFVTGSSSLPLPGDVRAATDLGRMPSP